MLHILQAIKDVGKYLITATRSHVHHVQPGQPMVDIVDGSDLCLCTIGIAVLIGYLFGFYILVPTDINIAKLALPVACLSHADNFARYSVAIDHVNFSRASFALGEYDGRLCVADDVGQHQADIWCRTLCRHRSVSAL